VGRAMSAGVSAAMADGTHSEKGDEQGRRKRGDSMHGKTPGK
jgi:hypothetical protein